MTNSKYTYGTNDTTLIAELRRKNNLYRNALCETKAIRDKEYLELQKLATDLVLSINKLIPWVEAYRDDKQDFIEELNLSVVDACINNAEETLKAAHNILD